MKIILHTGMHKTGTTSLQNALFRHHSDLMQRSFKAFINPLPIVVNCPHLFDPIWINTQIDLAEKEGLTTLIFSAEIISTFEAVQLARLVKLFEGHDVTLVTTFRHWVSYLPSRWSQSCLRRDAQSFPEYLERLKSPALQASYEPRFGNIVRNMEQARPQQIRVLSFDNALRAEGILPLLLTHFGLPEDLVEKITSQPERKNERHDQKNYEIIRLFNAVLSRMKGNEPDALFIGLTESSPVRELYDISPVIDRILTNEQGLKQSLETVIKKYETEVLLSRTITDILAWEKDIESAAQPYLVNPVDGQLYGFIADKVYRCSKVGLNDLSPLLLKQMETALNIGLGLSESAS